jgi:two-component system cell cycle sensor histidine kinase/response regulator CckA
MSGRDEQSGGQLEPELAPQESDRLNDVLEVLVALAAGDFDKRAKVGDGRQLLDGIATGLNMLAEELIRQRTFEEAMDVRVRESERLALVGQLAASVAHEINNPAAFVLANLVRLRDTWPIGGLAGQGAVAGPPGQEVASILQDCVTGVERIAAIVGGLKSIGRRETGPHVAVDLAAVLDDASKMVDRDVRYRARFLRTSGPLAVVVGDHGQLVQVFTNLLLNAAQAVPEGASDTHRIEVRASVGEGRVTVSVHDTGAGIAVSDRDRVFEPFFTTKPRGLGTGLGLTTSLEIARDHGGTIEFDSLPGRGSTFRVILPLAEAPATAPCVPESSDEQTALRLLIVDDEELLLRAYKRLYGSRYSVTVALGGRMAQVIVEGDQAWDAILCDLMMPECDGALFHAWVAARYPDLARRVIVCSGGAFTTGASTFLARFDGPLLAKPFTRSELLDAIAALPRRAPRSGATD